LQNRKHGRVTSEVLSGGPGSDPFRHSIPTVKSTWGVRKGATLRGDAIGTNALASDADVYQHANGPPSRLARIAGDKRCSKEPRERDPTAQAASTLCSVLSAYAFPMSHGPTWKVSLAGGELSGSRVRLSRPSVGESRVARCGAPSSNLLCIQRGRNEQR